jgi:hypothetical protein
MKNLLFFTIAMLMFSFATMTSCSSDNYTNQESSENVAAEALSSEMVLSGTIVQSFRDVDENSYGREQLFTETSQSNFNRVQPPKRLDWSLEREQLNERNLRWNDVNKISYIYLIDYGKVMAFYIIKGKVSSVNSQITNPEQLAAPLA